MNELYSSRYWYCVVGGMWCADGTVVVQWVCILYHQC